MKKLISLISVLLTLCYASASLADSVNLGLSGDSAEFEYSTGGDYKGSVDFGFTAYYNSLEEEKDVETNDGLFSINMQTSLEGDSSSRLLFSLGGSLYLISLDRVPYKKSDKIKNDFYAGIELSGKIGYLLPTTLPSVIYMRLGWGPDIVNSGNIEYLRTIKAVYELALSPAAVLQLGYRNYLANFTKNKEHLEENEKTFENRVFAGIKLRF